MTIQRIPCSFLGIVFSGVAFLVTLSTSAQNLYVAGYGGFNGVYQITSTGGQSNFVSGLTTPTALAFDKMGNLFVADAGSESIIEITSGGATNTIASSLNTPYGLTFDNAGDLFESDFGSNRILEFTNHNGVLNGSPGVFCSGLNGPVGLAFNGASNLFEADFKSGNIYEFTNYNGLLVSNLNVFVSGLTNPAVLAFNNSNVLFVGNDTFLGGVTEVMPNGSTNAFASGLNQPLGLAFDNAGNLFVANQNVNDIVKITPSGTQSIYSTWPGTNYPSGVAFAPIPHLQTITTNKTFRIAVAAPSPHYPAVIQASTNLTSWTAIYTNTPPFAYTDSTSLYPHRYYRAFNH